MTYNSASEYEPIVDLYPDIGVLPVACYAPKGIYIERNRGPRTRPSFLERAIKRTIAVQDVVAQN